MANVLVVVPVYQPVLNELEQFSLDYSLRVLASREVCFIGPQPLDRSYYAQRYAHVPYRAYSPASFRSIAGYNRLLLDKAFYAGFERYDHILILQVDAIVIRDDLDRWCASPFDYVGAPWPDGVELLVNAGQFEGDKGKRVRAHVGNGGLSLRRISACLRLLDEFPTVLSIFTQSGSSEDLFFSIMGALSQNFIIPNEMTAAQFSLELRPSYYAAVINGLSPMGGHAWWKYEPAFWHALLSGQPDQPVADRVA